MGSDFANILKQLRTDKGFSQQQLADMLFVDRSSVASWETGRRVPDAILIARICECLGVDADVLLGIVALRDEKLNVIIVDDEKLILSGSIPVLKEAMPNAEITGFTRPSDAISFARQYRVSLAFLDIEMGRKNGFDLCNELLSINPHMNIVFLTAYMNYAYQAWNTGASGFLMKPLTVSNVLHQLTMLRHPFVTPPAGSQEV